MLKRDVLARRLIKAHEGFSDRLYYDSEGVPTVGWGHNCLKPWPRHVLEQLFDLDYREAEEAARRLVKSFDELDEVRQAVLVNMAFNLGQARLASFSRMLAAVEAKDYETAAREMLDSKWARQVGRRARELAQMMREGKWPESLKPERGDITE